MSGITSARRRVAPSGGLVPKFILSCLACAVCASCDRLDQSGPVKRFLGVSDATALIGRVFEFAIPKDAFAGRIRDFVVSEAGEPMLPSWLRFDQKTRSFQGIPLEKDVGQYYISVKAQGAPSHTGKNVAKDVFSIDVVEDGPDANSASGLTQKCVPGEVLTVATVIFDADLENLDPGNRVNLLEKAASVMRIPRESLKLKPLSATSRAFDASAIMAGPGNARSSKHPGAVLQWRVGCSGIVDPDQSERIAEIEKMSKDGSLGDELNHPVVGWHVTNRQRQSVARREKRQARDAAFAATPVPGFVPTRWPHTTERVDEYTDETNAPESRIVPTMHSPVFSSSSHHHRHHHGKDTPPGERGHHKHRGESVRITASPVLPRLATPYAPSLGTPVLTPDRPSTYDGTLTTLDIVPTRVSQEERTPTLIAPSATPAITPYTEIKPSRPQTGGPTAIIPGVPNSKPFIQNRMRKLSIVAGKVWSFEIPSNTFGDLEDGDTRSLKLIFMTQDRTAIGQSSWIQFDPEKQVLYALPLDENIGKYRFILEALDSNGDAVQDELDVHVRQHPGHRAVHHAFSLSLVSPKWKFPVAIEWEIEVVKKLAKLFGDRNTSLITVKDVTLDPLKISWTNDSLPRHPCPRDRIERLASKLIKDESGQPTPHLTKILGKEIKVAEAYVTYMGVCQPPASTTTPTKTDGAPQMRNAIERVNATIGEILRFKIPEDTFFDAEDGGTRNLKLVFLTIDSAMVPESSWVRLDQKSQELYGLPFEGDKGGEFNMIAQDSDGHTANDVFTIVVHPRVQRKSAIEFSMHLDADFNQFNRNTSQKVLVAWKLSKLYGDPDPRYVTVNSISKGSVVYSWTNNTLPHHPCPREKVENLVGYLMNDNETISSKLIDALGSDYRVLKVDIMPMGSCMTEFGPASGTEVPLPPVVHVPTEESEPTTTGGDEDDIYITTIIPAVVIAIMLIIAAMVACFLYRKRRKGKMTMNENGAFVTKGIPIIFADELDEKNDPAKPPIILRDEKPPLAPVDYPRSVSASSRDSTPQTDRKEAANLRDTNADLHHPDPHFSPPYQPPPPFTSSRDNKNSRPKATPTYRQPPPYVPP